MYQNVWLFPTAWVEQIEGIVNVPVIEPVISEEKLRLLLAEQHESSSLDYKRQLSLNETRALVELAKDVGAMQIDGGFIVIGADDFGVLTGELTKSDSLLLDEATIRPKLARYLPEPFEIRCAVHTIEGCLVAIMYVAPNDAGFCIFRADGNFQGGTAFRAGEVYARHGTSSEPWQQRDIDRIISRQVAAEKEQWRREFAVDLERATLSPQRQQLSRASASTLTWQLDEDTFNSIVIEQLRTGDDIPLKLLFHRLPSEARVLLTPDRIDDFRTLLDRLTCLAALFLNLDLPTRFVDALKALTKIYELGFDQHGGSRTDLGVKTSSLWLEIIRRVYALGALAVRRDAWDEVRSLILQRPLGLVRGEHYSNWLRHALTMGSRSGDLEEDQSGQRVSISLLSLAQQTAARLRCVSQDAGDDDDLLNSIVQFDVYFNIAALGSNQRASGAGYYPNFSRFYSHRSDPAFRKVIEEPVVRSSLFQGDDEELATALRTLFDTAQHESFRYSGWHGVDDEVVQRFLIDHPAAKAV